MEQQAAQEGGGFGLSRDQVEVFAAGLYRLAACDGVDEREMAIIREFVTDAGAADLAEKIDGLVFDPVIAYDVLESSWLRTLFLRAALLVIRSDGTISDQEVETISWMADAFGVHGGYPALLEQIEGESLS